MEQKRNEDLYKRHWDELVKFMYYVIGLAVACIAFSIHSSMDTKLTCNSIPLGVAIIFWGMCVVTGLSYLGKIRYTLQRTITLLELNYFKDNVPYQEIEIEKDLQEVQKTGLVLYNLCTWGLILGAISFIIWRVLEMLP